MITFVVVLILAAVLVSPATASRWNSHNDPTAFLAAFHQNTHNRRLETLPLHGKVKRQPWSSYFVQNNKGGIAERFESNYRSESDTCSASLHARSQEDHLTQVDLNFLTQEDLNNALCPAKEFHYTLHSKNELLRMSISDKLHKLSPAEKYDILVSNYDYPTVKENWSAYKDFSGEMSGGYWHGMCHAWSLASTCLPLSSPNSVLLVQNKDKVFIPFSFHDIASLLTYEVNQNWDDHRFDIVQAGEECHSDLVLHPEDGEQEECWDINPGTFHVILTNVVGQQGESFVADVARSSPVWNKPIASFSSYVEFATEAEYLSHNGHAKAVRGYSYYKVSTECEFVVEVWPGPAKQVEQNRRIERKYEYFLEVDEHGDIVGGNWIEWDRPDYVWRSDCLQVEALINRNSNLAFLYNFFEDPVHRSSASFFDVKSPEAAKAQRWIRSEDTHHKGIAVYHLAGESAREHQQYTFRSVIISGASNFPRDPLVLSVISAAFIMAAIYFFSRGPRLAPYASRDDQRLLLAEDRLANEHEFSTESEPDPPASAAGSQKDYGSFQDI